MRDSKDYRIREANPGDAHGLLTIYAPYVEHTAITFEYEVPSVEEFANRIETIQRKYPYLVMEDEERILGYAYAGAFKGRAAYDWAVETTIYLSEAARGQGLGRILYEALEIALKERHFLNLYACIAYPQVEDEYLTQKSVQFHQALGYEIVGTFHQCGYKFHRWYDMVWMEKMLGEHTPDPEAVWKERCK